LQKENRLFLAYQGKNFLASEIISVGVHKIHLNFSHDHLDTFLTSFSVFLVTALALWKEERVVEKFEVRSIFRLRMTYGQLARGQRRGAGSLRRRDENGVADVGAGGPAGAPWRWSVGERAIGSAKAAGWTLATVAHAPVANAQQGLPY